MRSLEEIGALEATPWNFVPRIIRKKGDIGYFIKRDAPG